MEPHEPLWNNFLAAVHNGKYDAHDLIARMRFEKAFNAIVYSKSR